jgi:hypothetical protein
MIYLFSMKFLFILLLFILVQLLKTEESVCVYKSTLIMILHEGHVSYMRKTPLILRLNRAHHGSFKVVEI